MKFAALCVIAASANVISSHEVPHGRYVVERLDDGWSQFTVCNLEAEAREKILGEEGVCNRQMNSTQIQALYEEEGKEFPGHTCRDNSDPEVFRCRMMPNSVKNALLASSQRQVLMCSRHQKANIRALTRMHNYINSVPNGVSHRGSSLAPKMIRAIFHDAADFNNLINKDGTNVTDFAGGLDGCLHLSQADPAVEEDIAVDAEAQQNDEIEGNPDHNKGLSKAYGAINHMHRAFKYEMSKTDMLVLLGTLGLKYYDGPEIPMKFGREDLPRDQCLTKERLLNKGPKKSWDLQDNRDFFGALGFNDREMVALMDLKDASQETCQKFDSKGNTVDCMNRGSYFDRTPQKFDNDYFKVVKEASASTEELQNCSALNPKRYEFPNKTCSKETSWCNATTHATSTRSFADPVEYQVQRKLAVFASDFTAARTLPDIMTEFAEDQSLFFATFKEAFGRVLEFGYEEDDFFTCIPDECTFNLLTKKFDCANEELEEADALDMFKISAESCTSNTDGVDVESATNCLLQNTGISTTFQCDNNVVITCNQQQQFEQAISSVSEPTGDASSFNNKSFRSNVDAEDKTM
eukprot:Awhi_evm1s4030